MLSTSGSGLHFQTKDGNGVSARVVNKLFK